MGTVPQYKTVEADYGNVDKQTHDQVIGFKNLPIQLFKVKLSSEKGHSYNPGDVIKGNVFIKNNSDLGCLGVAVSLEGFASVSYQSGSVTRKKVEKQLSHENNKWSSVFLVGHPDDYHNFSRHYINSSIISRISGKQIYHIIPAGDNVFPFTISTVKLNPFAGTFKGTNGEVHYRVIACVIIKAWRRHRSSLSPQDFYFVEKPVEFKSYFNLETQPLTTVAVAVENKNSFLSKPKLKVNVYFSRTGFLPGEDIPFTLNVSNPSRKNVSRFQASLVCKTTYSSDASSRINSIVLERRESEEIIFDLEGNAEWNEIIFIPQDLYPSVSGQLIQRQYSVKIEIYTFNQESPIVKPAIVPIIIGTVREDESLSIENLPLSRSMSMMSLTSSTGSFDSLPPLYDDIFSRFTSRESRNFSILIHATIKYNRRAV